MDYTVRKLSKNEVPQFVDLIESVHWNYSREQIREAWEVFADGLFGAVTSDGRLLSVAAFVQLGGQLAAFGLYVTHPDVRKRGIGSAVCKVGMDSVSHLNLGSFSKIGLEPYYEGKGFHMFNQSVALHGQLQKPRDHPQTDVVLKAISEKDIPEVAKFDLEKVNHGVDRNKFWRAYFPNCLKCIMATKNQTVVGFGCLRTSEKGVRLSPLYALDDVTAESLIHELISDVSEGTHSEASVITDSPQLRKLFLKFGIGTSERCMTRMFTKNDVPASPHVYTGPNFHTTLW